MSELLGPSSALEVLADLRRLGVRHCLWRGSARLEQALAGRSDFDLLVDAGDSARAEAAFVARGYRRACAAPGAADPGVVDWFGLGGAAGPLVHLHVHYRLVAGERRCNRFRLPWEREVLDSAEPLARSEIAVAAPAVEGALLLVRCALELRWRDRLPAARGALRACEKVRADLARLLERTGAAAVTDRLRAWLPNAPSLGDRLPHIAPADLWAVRRAALHGLRSQAVRSGPAAAFALWRRELAAARRALQRRWPIAPRLLARGSSCGGMLVAITGPAPAAAALAGALHDLFAAKFDVLRLALDGAMPGAQRRLARALRARSRGLLVLGELGAGLGPWGGAPPWPAAPDLVLSLRDGPAPPDGTVLVARALLGCVPIDVDAPAETRLAQALAAVWRGF